jgi:D-alanyl-D-alanine carboxypeptidase
MILRMLQSAAATAIASSLWLLSLTGQAQAAPALVVELSSGRVIHAEEATRPWYPASLTKLMTAYVALDAVRRGKITLRTPMRVSRRAYRMAPSKMGFKPGSEITLESALKIIMVKSANDVSVTIAEGISGSVEAFAAQMNATARSLGMYESHFVNPNGLHNPGHISSARDMAILARALFLHFPEQHELYGIGAIRVGRRVMRNHNGLIGRYPGANGMKTGYVCASGFNVVASATRYGKTIIAVVMGSPSSTVRTFQAMALLDKGFANSGYSSSQLEGLSRSAYRAPPNMRSEICNRSRRRELIRQYISSITPPTSGSTWSGGAPASAYSGDSNSAAAFFSADKRGNFRSGDDAGEDGDDTRSSLPQLRLPPRAAMAPIPVYVGRAPGWSGKVAGPASAEPEDDAKPDSGKSERTATRGEAEPGKPLRLRGAHARSKKVTRSKAAVRSRAASRKSKIRGAKARASRKAVRSKTLRRGKAAARTSSRKRSTRR